MITNLTQFLTESRKTRLLVCDIDDTLLKSDPDMVGVWKNEPGRPSRRLTSGEYAVDPDVKTHPEWFDFSEFRDPERVYRSILGGRPLTSNLKIVDDLLRSGYDFTFLTARGCEDVIRRAIGKFMRFRDSDGRMRRLGSLYKDALGAAVNDAVKSYPGSTDAEKKGNVLRDLCRRYDKVVFIDDDPKNVANAKALGIKNLTVIAV